MMEKRLIEKRLACRNIVVHRYLEVDPAIVRAVLAANLEDLGRFVRSIRDRLATL